MDSLCPNSLSDGIGEDEVGVSIMTLRRSRASDDAVQTESFRSKVMFCSSEYETESFDVDICERSSPEPSPKA
jgi:hypothetical protein